MPRRFNLAAWIGPPLAFGGMVSYFTLFARSPVLRDVPWVNLPLVLGGISLSVLGMVRAVRQRSRWWLRGLAGLGLAVSLLVGGFFVAYVFVLSYALPAPTATATSLDVAPDFELPDSKGAMHRLSDYRGSRVVLVFYRGHW